MHKTCWGFKMSCGNHKLRFLLLALHSLLLPKKMKENRSATVGMKGVRSPGVGQEREKKRKHGGVQSTRIGTQGATFQPDPQITGPSLRVL